MNVKEACAELTRDLTMTIRSIKVEDLPSTVEKAEEALSEILSRVLFEFFVASHPTAKRVGVSNHFSLAGSVFKIAISDRSLLKPSTLGVAVLRTSRALPPVGVTSVKQTRKLEGCGAYSSVEVILDGSLSRNLDEIGSISKALYEAGYACLLEIIREGVRKLETDICKELYHAIRSYFPGNASAVGSSIWLLIIEQDRQNRYKGFYVLDTQHAEDTIGLLIRSRSHNQRSPAELFSHLLSEAIDFEEMHSRFAVKSKAPLDKRQVESQCAFRHPDMAAAEDEMYRDMATLCPIVVEGSAFLVAVFPARFKSEILPVLSERLPEIQKIFKDKRDNVRRKLGKLENLPQTMLNPTLFECIGRFLRGLMGLE